MAGIFLLEYFNSYLTPPQKKSSDKLYSLLDLKSIGDGKQMRT